jgi:hypothetical protein
LTYDLNSQFLAPRQRQLKHLTIRFDRKRQVKAHKQIQSVVAVHLDAVLAVEDDVDTDQRLTAVQSAGCVRAGEQFWCAKPKFPYGYDILLQC